MYKPHTIEQYKVYRFLEENFALEHFLLAPLSRFGLMLEDKTDEKIAFAFLNNCVQEIPVPAPADPETVTAFLKQFRSLTPHPVIHDFEALTRWWLDNPNPLTYQQALGMSDDLYRHFLSHPLISEDEALRLARKGLVTESEYNDLQLSKVGGETGEDDTTPPNRQPVDPRIWYETQGRSVLETLISDLNSRGHSKLTLREDGDICIEQGEDAVSQEHLNNFPQKVYWPRLAEVPSLHVPFSAGGCQSAPCEIGRMCVKGL